MFGNNNIIVFVTPTAAADRVSNGLEV